jgi:flagellar biosynthesis/type III secretory pathway chaperone
MGRMLKDLRDQLVALVESIQELNGINKRLIDFSVKSVKGSVAFLKKRFFNNETYSPDGVVNDELQRLSVLNNRA